MEKAMFTVRYLSACIRLRSTSQWINGSMEGFKILPAISHLSILNGMTTQFGVVSDYKPWENT